MKNAAMMKKNAPRFPDYKKAVVFNDGKLTVVPQKAPDTKEYKQKQLQIVCDYLGYEGISTHSFRKWYATEIYKANG